MVLALDDPTLPAATTLWVADGADPRPILLEEARRAYAGTPAADDDDELADLVEQWGLVDGVPLRDLDDARDG